MTVDATPSGQVDPPRRPSSGRTVVVGRGIVGNRVARLLGAAAEVVRSVDELPNDTPGQDLVILTTGAPHADAAARLVARGVSVVSVSDAVEDVRAMLDLDDVARDQGAVVVVGAAMAPGLSGLLARYLSVPLERCDEIHVAFHATAGPACARQHHRALGGRAFGWHDGEWIERPAGAGRELCWFPEPVGARDCYRAELPDPLLLHRAMPDVGRISARVSATRRDRLTARLPMLRPPHVEGGIGALRVEVRGTDVSGARAVHVGGIAEYVGMAAAATAVAAHHAVREGALSAGVVTTACPEFEVRSAIRRISACGVRLQEFTGVPQHG